MIIRATEKVVAYFLSHKSGDKNTDPSYGRDCIFVLSGTTHLPKYLLRYFAKTVAISGLLSFVSLSEKESSKETDIVTATENIPLLSQQSRH
ncbi:hypothetical protein [Chryseobacterium gambrini]|jgi:hypothetical protein|uniref:hypothetical protein n=1 Tax=Chryseobacterium gambrini TaxID=373672 RepID=UPI0025B62042|nr:hypothetical protein [Chryseobacterium gambrini]MDN4028931.1 hypothetical protein [Chryseobacterium gambrini]